MRICDELAKMASPIKDKHQGQLFPTGIATVGFEGSNPFTRFSFLIQIQ